VTRLAPLALACGLVFDGCVLVGWGTYPFPSGDGVEPQDVADLGVISAVVHGPDVSAKVTVQTYDPSLVLVGLVVPIIPLFWWPMGTNPLECRIYVTEGKRSFRPDSMRVLVGSNAYEPTSIEITQYVSEGGDPPRVRYDHPPPDRDLLAEHETLLVYRFAIAAPDEPFAIVVQGLPRIDYVPKRQYFGGSMQD